MTDGAGLPAEGLRTEELLAAYLDQRRRLGEPEFLSGTLHREEFVKALADLRSAAPAPSPLSPAPSPPSRSPSLLPNNLAKGLGSPSAPLPASPPPLEQGANLPPRPTPKAAAPGKTGSSDAAPAVGVDTEGADYETLKALASQCTSCRLAEGRTHVVFSDGNPKARLMVVGEAPGANEDATGLPFVGQAGKLLDLMLASVDLSREDSVYIANVLKCRPPGNRNPLPDEIEACSGFLKRQIELVSPQVLLTVGSFAAQLLTGTQTALGKLRGTVHSYHGVPLIVTYHPAALLRNPGWSRPTWDDLQLLRQVMDQA